GLELLKTLPDTAERAQQELRLQGVLLPALTFTRGYAAPEVGEACARTLELSRQMGETPRLFRALAELWLFSLERAKLQKARELNEQLPTLAQRLQNPFLLLLAHSSTGMSLFWVGELGPARAHLE